MYLEYPAHPPLIGFLVNLVALVGLLNLESLEYLVALANLSPLSGQATLEYLAFPAALDYP